MDTSNVKEVKMRKNGEDIREIIFRKINDDFSWGKYADFEVIMMNKNEYINSTKMCQMISEKIGKERRFRDWKVTDPAKELIKESSAGYPADYNFIIITGG